MPKDKTPLSDEEKALFHQAAKDVKPLKAISDKHYFVQKPPKKINIKKAEQCPASSTEESNFTFTDHVGTQVFADDRLLYVQSGISSGYLKKLRQGLLPIDAKLDLHGSTVEEAREILLRFMSEAKENHFRVVKIIHGRGHHTHAEPPVLKNKVNVWLRQFPDILAFCSALPRDGGTGAVYVLLRKFSIS